MVAMGIPLYAIKDIRRLYNMKDINASNAFDLSNTKRMQPIRHCVACRVTAENPSNNFSPTSGLITELNFRSLPNVWGYFSLKARSSINDFSDSQFGHIFASGKDRDEARKNMVVALSQLEIRGETISTTIEFLSYILEHEEYKAGDIHTSWLEMKLCDKKSVPPPHLNTEKIVLLGAVTKGHIMLKKMEQKLMNDLINGRDISQQKYGENKLVAADVELIYADMKYRVLVEKTSSVSYTLRMANDWKVHVIVRSLSDKGLLISMEDETHCLYHNGMRMRMDGHTVVFEEEYDPSNICSTMPGKLVKLLKSSGQHVKKGETFAEIEVMKMLMPLISPEAGVIQIIAQQNEILQVGQRIATLVLDDPSHVKTANVFVDTFETMNEPQEILESKVDKRFENAKSKVECMLNGYIGATENIDVMMDALQDPMLPVHVFLSVLEPLQGRITGSLYDDVNQIATEYANDLSGAFPSTRIMERIQKHGQQLMISPLKAVCERYMSGAAAYTVSVISDLLDTFLQRRNEFMDYKIRLRGDSTSHSLEQTIDTIRSHFQFKHIECVIIELLNVVQEILKGDQLNALEMKPYTTRIIDNIKTLTNTKAYGRRVSVKSRQIVPIHDELNSFIQIAEHHLTTIKERLIARKLHTTYVYDWPFLFKNALERLWNEHATDATPITCSFEEYVLRDDQLVAMKPNKQNKIAMVAWKVHMKTPQFPDGRSIIIVANDITIKAGTFSHEEDLLYNAACNMAQEEGLPFIFLAANSGARIGLSQEIKDKFLVSYLDGEAEYLYLDEDTFDALPADNPQVFVDKIVRNGEIRYRITDIIGERGIGVENLSFSGLIAGNTSRAYLKTFTLSYVTGRAVGIGAYLVRLGQRIIQKVDSPVLLTGYRALNNLLGKTVYSSNQQIGGAQQIMMANGITHKQVTSDEEGVYQILKWLSYVACGAPQMVHIARDPIDRDVTCYPFAASDKYDPRCLLDAQLFDKDSFTEYLDLWAPSVVIGRARLGGIPCGVIVTETRTTECIIPPDPAMEDLSREVSFSKAGSIFYPDSAYKTSQAIRDFEGEELPLFILANWRGFSGGQRDMFDSILKYGSYIIDALSSYTQPVFVYLPPMAQLRGGSWVVFDSLINERGLIEMYCAENASANILEATAVVGLKFKKDELISTMHRLDATLIQLDGKAKTESIEQQIRDREQCLLPMFAKISLMFARLHDTPRRMKHVKVIQDIVQWKNSRRRFYWRLRKKLCINQSVNCIMSSITCDWNTASKQFNQWIPSRLRNANDQVFVECFPKSEFDTFKAQLKQKYLEDKLKNIIARLSCDKKELQAVIEKLFIQ
eukprot:56238_1